MESVENLEIMRILDEIYLDHPYYGCLKKRWICCDYFINRIRSWFKSKPHSIKNRTAITKILQIKEMFCIYRSMHRETR
jgi:hypothetical protein